MNPTEIMARLETLESDLAERQESLETAAFLFYKNKRLVEQKLAELRLLSAGKNQLETQDNALLKLIKSEDKQLYADWITAEATYESQKLVTRVIETRVSIGQSLLRIERP